jgi:hypothetical protein
MTAAVAQFHKADVGLRTGLLQEWDVGLKGMSALKKVYDTTAAI